MRSPVMVPQTMQKAESDVEHLATKKSPLQASTDHRGPLEQLPSAPKLSAGPEGQETWSGCVSLQHLPIAQKTNLTTETAVNPLYYSGLQFSLYFLPNTSMPCYTPFLEGINLYSSEKTLFFFPLKAPILCEELSHIKSTILPLRNNN